MIQPVSVRSGGGDLVKPGVLDLFWAFFRLGMVAFGGPTMVTYIKQLAVDKKKWLQDTEFLEGVALCQAVPGATAMQCAAFVGLRTHRLAGAVASYLGFGLPAFLLILALSALYQYGIRFAGVTAALSGLRLFVVALVANSALVFGRSAVRGWRDATLGLATGTLFFFQYSPFLIVAGAGLVGALGFQRQSAAVPAEHGPRLGWHTLSPAGWVFGFGALFVGGLFLVGSGLAEIALTMMRVDIFAFGGGYSAMPLMFREVVNHRGWLPGNVFLDGIALGQVTPGPIVITATFVGYQVRGFWGAVAGTLGIFLPSLFSVALVDPWFRRLRASAVFQGVLRGLVLSFAGLLVSVTIQFARLAPWSLPGGIIFSLALAAILFRVAIPCVVLAVALVSAVVL